MNPYSTLNLKKACTKPQVRAAFRKASKTLHPDVGGGAEEFRQLKLAHDILLDDDRRARFDATGDISDGPPKTSLQEKVNQILGKAFVEAFQRAANQRIDPSTTDFVGTVGMWLQENRDKLAQIVDENERRHGYLKRMVKKFRMKGRAKAPITLRDICQGQLDATARALAPMREELSAFDQVIAIVKKQDFEMDAPQPGNFAMPGTGSTRFVFGAGF